MRSRLPRSTAVAVVLAVICGAGAGASSALDVRAAKRQPTVGDSSPRQEFRFVLKAADRDERFTVEAASPSLDSGGAMWDIKAMRGSGALRTASDFESRTVADIGSCFSLRNVTPMGTSPVRLARSFELAANESSVVTVVARKADRWAPWPEVVPAPTIALRKRLTDGTQGSLTSGSTKVVKPLARVDAARTGVKISMQAKPRGSTQTRQKTPKIKIGDRVEVRGQLLTRDAMQRVELVELSKRGARTVVSKVIQTGAPFTFGWVPQTAGKAEIYLRTPRTSNSVKSWTCPHGFNVAR